MTEDRLPPSHDAGWLREDLLQEYYAILDVVSGFDQRLMTIKGWSVTLSLAALALGFQYTHYALFALGAATGLGFLVHRRHDEAASDALLRADEGY